jgi:hypothetical protein
MVAGIITAICGGFVGVGGFIFGIVKWKAEQKAKKEAARKAEEAEQKRLEEQTILKGVADMIAPILEQNTEQSYAIDELRELHEEETQNIKNLIDANEMDRMRAEIMQFVCYLRNGMIMDAAEFKHIHHVYDKYHNMGGNSYIDADFEYIKQKEREFNNNAQR